jgi:hypothetical protein
MPLKHPLLVSCAAVALIATVRTQVVPTPATAAPAALDLDAARALPPRAPQASGPVAPRPARPAPPAPFVLAPPKPAASPGAEAEAAKPGEIDLSALRYYAAQNDLGRVSAEIRLLRASHPDWEPPPDLFSDGGSGLDEQPLWDLMARHDYAGVHARMEEMRRDKPDWQPSNDLAGKLALAEAHDGLARASDAHDWSGVIAAATATPALLTCADVDALWRTAEALARTGDEARAVSAYRYVLSNCPAPELRLATVQKASGLLASPKALQGLVDMGQRGPDGRGEFDGLRADLVRRRVGEATADPAAAAASPQDLATLSASAATPAGADDAQLLGWYARSRKDYAGAERWFRTALGQGQNAKAAEGLVLTLRDAGNLPEARRLAVQYAGLDPLNRKLLVELQSAGLADPKAPALSRDEVAALGRAVDDLKSSDGAQALGWSLFKAGDVAGAEGWFRKSADWQANEPAAIGLIVAAHRLHHAADYAARVSQYRAVYPRVAELEAAMRPRPVVRQAAHAERGRARPTLRVAGRSAAPRQGGGWDRDADDIVKTYDAGQYDAAVAKLEQRRQTRAEPRGLSVVRGWAMYHRGDWEGARQVFSGLDKGSYSQERMEGLRVIEQSYTNPRYR